MLYSLLEAIRKLHTQLDKTMEDNHALRKKLEEHLGHLVLDTPPSKPPSATKDEKASPTAPHIGSVKRNLFSSALHSIDVSPQQTQGDEVDVCHYLEEMPTKDKVEEVLGDMKCPQETYKKLKTLLADSYDKIWRVNQLMIVLSSKLGKDNKILSEITVGSSSTLTCIKGIIEVVGKEFVLLINEATTDANSNVSDENDRLRREILVLKKKLRHQDNLIRTSLSKLEASKRKKEDELSDLVSSVQETYQVMKYARETLTNKMQQAKTGHLVISPKH